MPLAIVMCASLCGSLAIETFRATSASLHREHMAVVDESETIRTVASGGRATVPYSVIPGGVYAPEELRSAMRRDSVVKVHYAGFDDAKVRFVKLQADSYRYVSYRRGNRIYWTKKQLLLPRGELLFTDGQQYARARCGNRLALYPQADPLSAVTVAENKPMLLAMDGAQSRPDTVLNRDIMPPPGTIPGPDLLPNLEGEASDAGARSILDTKPGPVASFFIQSWPLVILPATVQAGKGGGAGGNASAAGSMAGASSTPPDALGPTPVPEASAAGLVCLGALMVWWSARRRVEGGEDR